MEGVAGKAPHECFEANVLAQSCCQNCFHPAEAHGARHQEPGSPPSAEAPYCDLPRRCLPAPEDPLRASTYSRPSERWVEPWGLRRGSWSGGRRCSDPALLWVWRMPLATALIRLLGWETPFAAGVTLKRQKKKKKKTQREIEPNQHFFGNMCSLWVGIINKNQNRSTIRYVSESLG
uniref:Uncharacterized protein n=1 Tax=Catagonus wagneri TaxID=51154 RepID=A0A8C3YIZ8_9CETA